MRKSVNNLLAGIKSEFRTIQDLTYINGIFYVISEGRVVAFTPVSSHKTFPIFKEDAKQARSSHLQKIVASRDHLFMVESTGKSIVRSPRPVPVNVNFEPDSTTQSLVKTFEQQRGALISLYEYLSDKELLPRREFTTRRTYNSLKDLLFEQRVLIDPDLSDGPVEARVAPVEGRVASDKRLATLLCKYNVGLCREADALSRPVPANQTLTLPNVPIEPDLTLIDVSIGKRTVRETLSKLLTSEQLEQITTEYLLRINRASLQTLETEIALKDFIPTGQTGLNLKPGTILKIEQGRERVLGDLGSCGRDFNGRIERVSLEAPSELRSEAVENVLPRRASRGADSVRLTGVDTVVFDAKEWVKETIDLRMLEDSVQSLKTDAGCGSLASALGSPGETFVVTQAIRTSGSRYKLLKKDGSLRALTEKDVAEANLLGKPYVGKDYSLTVDEPIYVAYRLLRVNMGEPALQWLPVSADVVKAGTKQDVFSATGGVWRLPAARWRLSLFVNASDVYDAKSNLNRSLAVPGLSLLKEERVERPLKVAYALPSAPSGFTPDDPPQSQKDAIRKNREGLIKKIGSVPRIPGLSDVRVGVAESGDSVHMNHPDFAGAWYQKDGTTGLVPVAAPAGTAPASDDLIKDFIKGDHGDHVAGIIGARGETLPGLASGVQLFLLDTTNKESEASLEKIINDAIFRDVRLFNFSFTIGEGDTPQVNVSLNNLAKKMRTSSVWGDALFVAAAGNEGQDLTAVNDRVPVKWVKDIPNIIGVAAADESDHIFVKSNYGHKYIQLAAPGVNIYSTVSEGQYAFASGSSFAVPQVTAAAAMLRAQNVIHPSLIKGRLIYTADWLDQFDDDDSEKRKVWGGMLNMRRAVLQPDRHLLVLKTFKGIINSFTFPRNVEIKVKNDSGLCGHDDPDDDEGRPCPNNVTFDKILRISQQSNELLRIVYLDGKTLRIMRNALLEGKIRCDGMFELDQTNNQFLQTSKCVRDIEMGEIYDYVSAVPRGAIRF